MSVLRIRREEKQLWVTVNRPEAMNAINFELMEQLEEVLDILEQDESVCVFILTGAGEGAFISGGDLKEFHGIRSADEARQMAGRMLGILHRIEKLSCWTVACINGDTYGGGWEIMLAFDFRIASSKAVFGFSQGKFYLTPGWGGLTRLVESVGRSTALCWLGETAVIDAKTALDHRLIDRIASPEGLLKATAAWGHDLSRNDRHFIGTLKKTTFRLTRERRKGIEAELEPFSRLWEDKRHHSRVDEFLNSEG